MIAEGTPRLEVLDWGGSGRPIVLLGCYLTAHVYDDFAPKLINQFHAYGITRRGLGASDKPPAGYSLERSSQDVLDVLVALKRRKPILVGYACAGSMLTYVGSHSPDRIGGLVYFDAADDPTLTNRACRRSVSRSFVGAQFTARREGRETTSFAFVSSVSPARRHSA